MPATIEIVEKLVHKGDLDGALARCREALAEANSPQITRLYADLLAQSGDFQSAQLHYHKLDSVPVVNFEELRQALGLRNVVAIHYYGRSGTLFLQSLLDSHPQTVSFPGACIAEFYNFWGRAGGADRDQLIDSFCLEHKVLFDASWKASDSTFGGFGWSQGLTQMGSNRDICLTLDEEKFRSELSSLLPFRRISRRYFFQAIHAAYYRTLGLGLEHRHTIIHQAHSAPERGSYTFWHRLFKLPVIDECHMKLRQDFPDVRHVYCIRQPLETLSSMFVHLNDGETSHFPNRSSVGCHVISHVLLGGEPYPMEAMPRCAAIRLEDLHNRGPAAMKALADWIGIDWEDSLLLSTFQGVQWWNVAKSPVVSGFNQKTTQNKNSTKALNGLDRYRLLALLEPKYQHWCYRAGASSWLKLVLVLVLLPIPFQMEIKSWIHHLKLYGPSLAAAARILLGYARLRWNCLVSLWERGLKPRMEVIPLLPAERG